MVAASDPLQARTMCKMTNENIDLETIEIHLIGDEREIAKGIRLIDTSLRAHVVGNIRKRALSATPEDLHDLYQEVLLGIFQYARDGKYIPGDNPIALMTLIYTVIRNKATDWIRKKCAYKRVRDTSQDKLVDSVAETIEDSSINEAWQDAYNNEKRAIILRTIRELASKSKHRQRQVAEIIYMEFPLILDLGEIRELILQRYGEDITVIAVKSARQEVYGKIKEALSIAGYGDNEDD